MDKGNWPGMSRIARAIEILEAINEFYQDQGNVAFPLYPDAQILENEVGIADAIAQCLGQEEK